MIMATITQTNMFLLSLLISVSLESSHGSEIAIYWGQNGHEGSLKDTCNTGNYGIVILPFLDIFGIGQTPELNFAGHCNASTNGCISLSNTLIQPNKSSCGQPHLEAENADMAVQEEHLSQPKLGKSPVSNSRLQENTSCADSGQNLRTHKSTAVAGSEDNSVCNNNDALDQDERLEQQKNGEGDNVTEVMDTRDIPANSSGEPIDLLDLIFESP